MFNPCAVLRCCVCRFCSYHIGLLKAKLAKLKREILAPSSKGGPAGVGFDVTKSGDARVGMIGFPSVGKSTLLTKLTGTHSEAADYEFTTVRERDRRWGRSVDVRRGLSVCADSRLRVFFCVRVCQLTCIPGSIQYKGCKIQLLDLPGIIEGAKDGKVS